MTRPKLLDLFAGAQGTGVGFARAGFEVHSVDKEPHAKHPEIATFTVADAMEVLRDRPFLAGFDVIAAGPPCQRYSTITPDSTRNNHPDLIAPVRALLQAWGGLYVIENVEGARTELDHPIKLCGSAFGLGVRRHRLFESNAYLMQMPCLHETQGRPIGVYGDHPQDDSEYRRPDGTRRGHKAHDLTHAREVMGIDWMDWDDLADAIPPLYTEYIGRQLMDALVTA